MKSVLLSISLFAATFAGAQTSELRNAGPFTKLQVSDAVNVFYTYSDSSEIRVSANEKEISNVSTQVSGGTLQISAKGKFYNPVNIYVKGKGLNDVFCSGASSFRTVNTLVADSVHLSASGASAISAALSVSKVHVLQTGASQVSLRGKTVHLGAELSGASNLKSYDLSSDNAHLVTTGASVAKVHVNSKLNANASGGSSIRVKGEVKDISAEATAGASISRILDDKKVYGKDSTTFNWKGKKVIVIGDDKECRDTVKRHPSNRNFDHWAGFSVGVNGLMSPSGNFSQPSPYSYLDLNHSRSFNLQLNLFQQNFHIYKNYVMLVTGFGIEWRRFMFDNKTNLNADSSFTWGRIDSSNSFTYRKNMLKSTLLQVPLLLEINTSKNPGRSFHIAFGAIGQFMVGGKTKQQLTRDGYEIEKIRRDNYNMSPFQLKAHASIGYAGMTLFGEYNITPLFERGKGPEVYPFAIGARWVPFD